MKWTALMLAASLTATLGSAAQEKQITFTPKNHDLDNNDNFSPDGRFLCYDTRNMVGPGIDNGQSIELVEVATGVETLLYKPVVSVIGERPAPGVGAVSFSGAANEVAFIHGPPVDQLDARGPYGKPNWQGACVRTDGRARRRRGAMRCTGWTTDIAADRHAPKIMGHAPARVHA